MTTTIRTQILALNARIAQLDLEIEIVGPEVEELDERLYQFEAEAAALAGEAEDLTKQYRAADYRARDLERRFLAEGQKRAAAASGVLVKPLIDDGAARHLMRECQDAKKIAEDLDGQVRAKLREVTALGARKTRLNHRRTILSDRLEVLEAQKTSAEAEKARLEGTPLPPAPAKLGTPEPAPAASGTFRRGIVDPTQPSADDPNGLRAIKNRVMSAVGGAK